MANTPPAGTIFLPHLTPAHLTLHYPCCSNSGTQPLPDHNGAAPGSCVYGPDINFIGVTFRPAGKLCDRWVYEPGRVTPPNLFEAQLARRRGGAAAAAKAAATAARQAAAEEAAAKAKAAAAAAAEAQAAADAAHQAAAEAAAKAAEEQAAAQAAAQQAAAEQAAADAAEKAAASPSPAPAHAEPALPAEPIETPAEIQPQTTPPKKTTVAVAAAAAAAVDAAAAAPSPAPAPAANAMAAAANTDVLAVEIPAAPRGFKRGTL